MVKVTAYMLRVRDKTEFLQILNKTMYKINTSLIYFIGCRDCFRSYLKKKQKRNHGLSKYIFIKLLI